MPAVTVPDLTVLPRLADLGPDTGATERGVRRVTTAPRGFEGEGFPVRRAFAGVDLADLDPFIHMDQMGEVEYAPGEPKGTAWHPHRGFETVTYIIDGTFEHADNHGGGGLITNGDTQWMTAGGGVLHIERPPEALVASGGLFHGLQLWVNLPRAQKWVQPRYQDLRAGQASLVTSPDAGALVRVIAGSRRRTLRSRIDLHPDDDGPRLDRAGRDAARAVGPRAERAGLRALRRRLRGRRAPPGVHGAARGLRPGRVGARGGRGRARTAGTRSSRWCCSAGGRCASRSRGAGRS